MSDFDPQRARAKRPCPLWVDAFQRDTQHLEADEVGAYMLVLMAMWTRPTCDLPDDPARIARVARVSKRLWDSRVGPVIMAFLTAQDGVVFSERLRKEAAYVERQVKQQSDRKSGKKSDKSLKDKDAGESVDASMDKPRGHPSQQPNNPTEVDKSTSTQEAEDYQRYLAAHPNPVASDAGAVLFSELIAGGIEPSQIIGSAQAYAEKVKGWSSEAKIQQSDNFLDPERGKWRDHIPKSKAKQATEEEVLSYYAKMVLEKNPTASFTISNAMAGRLRAAKLVTESQLAEAGVAI